MAQKQVSVRISAQGGDKLKAELVQIGQVGERSFGQLERSSGQSTAALQNAGFQVQDFFVQVAGGTEPTRALAQQLPQLLGGLGLVGVLAGTAVAAVAALGPVFMGASEEALSLTDSLDALDKAMGNLETANRNTAPSMSELIDQYGRYAEQARDVLEVQRQIAFVESASALTAATQNIASMFGELERLNAEGQETPEWLREVEARFGNLNPDSVAAVQEALQITQDQAILLTEQFVALAEADGPEAQADALRNVVEQLELATGGAFEMTEEGRNLLTSLLGAEGAALALASIDMASNIGAGADQADRLANNLARVAGIQRNQARDREVVFDPRDPRFNADRAAAARIALEPNRDQTRDSLVQPVRSSGGGGGGGGGAAQNDQLREAQRLFEQTRTEAEKYATEQQRINQLLNEGYITADTYQRAIDMIGEKYKGAGDGAKFFEDLTGDLKDAFLDLAVSGENSFDAIAKSIKRAALEALIFGSGPLGGMLGGGLLSFFGGGGRGTGTLGLPSFDGGGSTGWGSRSGGLDGKGGFMAMLHPRETVVDHTRGGMTKGGTMVQINNFSGQPVQEQRERGPSGEELIRVTVGKQLAGGDHDRAMQRYGARPAAVKR
jgi:hypothetical protein